MASTRSAEGVATCGEITASASLDFSDSPSLTDESFQAVLAGCASLTSLSVAGCSELTDESYAGLLEPPALPCEHDAGPPRWSRRCSVAEPSELYCEPDAGALFRAYIPVAPGAALRRADDEFAAVPESASARARSSCRRVAVRGRRAVIVSGRRAGVASFPDSAAFVAARPCARAGVAQEKPPRRPIVAMEPFGGDGW